MAAFTIQDTKTASPVFDLQLAPSGNLPAVLTPQKPLAAYTPSIASVRDAFVLAKNLDQRFALLVEGKGKNVESLPAVKSWKNGMPFLAGYLPLFGGAMAGCTFMALENPALALVSAAVAITLPAYSFVSRWYRKEEARQLAERTRLSDTDVGAVDRVTGPVMEKGDALAQVVAEQVVARWSSEAVSSRAATDATRDQLEALTAQAPKVGEPVVAMSRQLERLAAFANELETREVISQENARKLELALLELTPIERAAVNPELQRAFFDEQGRPRKGHYGDVTVKLAAMVNHVPNIHFLAVPPAAIPAPAPEVHES